MQKKFVVIRNVKEGKIYIDNNPSDISPVGIELAYFDTTKEASDRYPTAIDKTNAAATQPDAAQTENKE